MKENASIVAARKFIPVMPTPFKENELIDFDGLSALTDMYLENGAGGLFANCLSSEMYDLTAEEKLALVRHVVKRGGGRVPVLASGNFGESIDEQATFIKRIYDCGVDTVILISCLIAAEEESYDVFTSRLLELTSKTPGIPLGIYECPIPYKRLIKPQLLGQLAASGRYSYHKDTCMDIKQVEQKVASTTGYAFGVYDAHMVNAVSSLRAGVAGLSCIQGNYFPELIVWLCNHFNDSSYAAEVDIIQQFLTDNMEVMHHLYPKAAKYYLVKRGLPITTVTRQDNNVDLSAGALKKMDRLYDTYKALARKLGIAAILSNN